MQFSSILWNSGKICETSPMRRLLRGAAVEGLEIISCSVECNCPAASPAFKTSEDFVIGLNWMFLDTSISPRELRKLPAQSFQKGWSFQSRFTSSLQSRTRASAWNCVAKLTETGGNWWKLAKTHRNSPKLVKTRRNSPKLAKTRRNSPKLAKKLTKTDENWRKLEKTGENWGKLRKSAESENLWKVCWFEKCISPCRSRGLPFFKRA